MLRVEGTSVGHLVTEGLEILQF